MRSRVWLLGLLMTALCRSIFEKSRTTVALESSSQDCALFAGFGGVIGLKIEGVIGLKVPFRRWLHSIREVLAPETRRAAKNARLVCGFFRKRGTSQKEKGRDLRFCRSRPFDRSRINAGGASDALYSSKFVA